MYKSACAPRTVRRHYNRLKPCGTSFIPANHPDVLRPHRPAADGLRPVRHRLVCHPPADTRNQHPQGARRHARTNHLAAQQALLPLRRSGLRAGHARRLVADATLAGAVCLPCLTLGWYLCVAAGCRVGRIGPYRLPARLDAEPGKAGGGDEE